MKYLTNSASWKIGTKGGPHDAKPKTRYPMNERSVVADGFMTTY